MKHTHSDHEDIYVYFSSDWQK